ncbi:hypothetical protein GMA11_03135 [Granulicatella sp. zg-ZJ]|uniref:hypothetical protein n=1 Tax=Granulicatella sp. zg-ZJ TaxID=2678504 RepID=UPI0013CFCAEB|nr:hypothetical protein [Granulicatella sp. zg-ZJ]NEW62381.1 hypothetical protein [Granulicatella sp. zg-ZJ]
MEQRLSCFGYTFIIQNTLTYTYDEKKHILLFFNEKEPHICLVITYHTDTDALKIKGNYIACDIKGKDIYIRAKWEQ